MKKILCIGSVTTDVIIKPVDHLPDPGVLQFIDSSKMFVGGCAANAYHATGDITGIYEYGCELFRKRMECAIMIQVAKDLENS